MNKMQVFDVDTLKKPLSTRRRPFFDKHYERCLKELVPIPIAGTPYNAYIFSKWYLVFTDPDETELNTGDCKVHECNVIMKIWKNYLDSLTINSKDFDGNQIIYQK